MDRFYEVLLALATGVISGVIATDLYARYLDYITHKKISMVGSWVEILNETSDRGISAGHIYFDRSKSIFKYDGTNYKNGGTKYSHWQTVSSYVDFDQRRFFYVFGAHIEGEAGPTYYGFGVLNLTWHEGNLIPSDGYFVSPSLNTTSQTHSMLRANFVYNRSDDGSKVVRFISKLRGRKSAS